MHTLPMSFTGSYTKVEPNLPRQNNHILGKMVAGVEKVVNCMDFSRPSNEIKYFSRTLTEFKDFSKRILNFKTFSRLYEQCPFKRDLKYKEIQYKEYGWAQ